MKSITSVLKNTLKRRKTANLSRNAQQGWGSHQEKAAFEADKARAEANRYGAPFFM